MSNTAGRQRGSAATSHRGLLPDAPHTGAAAAAGSGSGVRTRRQQRLAAQAVQDQVQDQVASSLAEVLRVVPVEHWAAAWRGLCRADQRAWRLCCWALERAAREQLITALTLRQPGDFWGAFEYMYCKPLPTQAQLDADAAADLRRCAAVSLAPVRYRALRSLTLNVFLTPGMAQALRSALEEAPIRELAFEQTFLYFSQVSGEDRQTVPLLSAALKDAGRRLTSLKLELLSGIPQIQTNATTPLAEALCTLTSLVGIEISCPHHRFLNSYDNFNACTWANDPKVLAALADLPHLQRAAFPNCYSEYNDAYLPPNDIAAAVGSFLLAWLGRAPAGTGAAGADAGAGGSAAAAAGGAAVGGFELDLSGNELDAHLMRALCGALLQRPNTLSRLSVLGSTLSFKDPPSSRTSPVADTITGGTESQTDTALPQALAAALASQAASLTHLDARESGVLRPWRLDDENMRVPAQAALGPMTKLQVLDLQGSHLFEFPSLADEQAFGGLLQDLRCLTELRGLPVTEATASQLQHLPASLRVLALDGSTELGCGGARVLAQAVLPRLEALQELSLCDCGIGEEGLLALAAALPRSLRHLRLDRNAHTPASVQALCAALAAEGQRLETLHLLGDNTVACLQALAAHLPSLPRSLRDLAVGFQQGKGTQGAGEGPSGSASEAPSVTGSDVGAAAAAVALCAALPAALPALQKLHVAGAPHAMLSAPLAAALARLPQLAALELQSAMSLEQAKAFLDAALPHMPRGARLQLAFVPVGATELAAVEGVKGLIAERGLEVWVNGSLLGCAEQD